MSGRWSQHGTTRLWRHGASSQVLIFASVCLVEMIADRREILAIDLRRCSDGLHRLSLLSKAKVLRPSGLQSRQLATLVSRILRRPTHCDKFVRSNTVKSGPDTTPFAEMGGGQRWHWLGSRSADGSRFINVAGGRVKRRVPTNCSTLPTADCSPAPRTPPRRQAVGRFNQLRVSQRETVSWCLAAVWLSDQPPQTLSIYGTPGSGQSGWLDTPAGLRPGSVPPRGRFHRAGVRPIAPQQPPDNPGF